MIRGLFFLRRYACFMYALGVSLVSSLQTQAAHNPREPRVRIEPGGGVFVERDDATWRLQAASALPAQPWLAVGTLGDTSFHVTQPAATRFLRLVNPAEDCPLPTH